MNRWLWLSLLVFALGPLAAQESPNLLTNPGFVGDGNGDGLADNWEYQPGAAREKLDVSMGLEPIAPGRFAQRLSCTRYEGGHAMLCQTGVVKVEADHWYECRLRYRGEKLSTAYVGLHDTNGWKQLGLWQSFSPRQSWRDLTAKFRADHTCSQTTRFQVWFTTTGTLWVSDLVLREVPPPPRCNVISDIGHKNLLPNGGFAMAGECDPRGWTALSDTHHAADLATAIPQSNFLSLQSARGLGAAWLSDPVLLDGALPYRLQANVAAAETPDCRLRRSRSRRFRAEENE